MFQESDHYICSTDKTIICLQGWSEPDKLCRTPICEFEDLESNTKKERKLAIVDYRNQKYCPFQPTYLESYEQGCGPHGDCVRPNVCACAVGWEGLACDQCVPLPGCLDGRCLGAALECVCNRYDGDGRRIAAGDAEATGQGKPRFTGSRCDIRESTVLDRVGLQYFGNPH